MVKKKNIDNSSQLSSSHIIAQEIKDFDPGDRPVTVNITFQHPSGRTVEYTFKCKGIIASMVKPESPLLDGRYKNSVLPITVGLSNSYELSKAYSSINDLLQQVYQDMEHMEQQQGGI